MPFTIVQTVEDGKRMLTCVPESWVNNNYLSWPKKKADKLVKDENSIPGHDWFLMPCIIKRSGLTYHEGQLAITVMTELPDTEEDTTATKVIAERKISTIESHDDILQSCLKRAAIKSITNQSLEETETEVPIAVEPIESTIHNVSLESPSEMLAPGEPSFLKIEKVNEAKSSTYMVGTENDDIDQQLQFILLPSEETNKPSSTDETTKKLDDLTVTVNAIEKKQNELQETQQQLLLRMISMQAMFEEFLRRTQQENLQKEIGFNPINSLDSLQQLEDTLKDDRSTAELINKFSLVCGTGKGRGLNNCFALVDVIFDRSFLTTCSWAGGARGEDKKKICFKSFERVIRLFFAIIVQSDKQFTIKECEDFFKNILRNSNRRNKAKLARASATKARVKKTKKAPEVPNSNENPVPEPGPSQEYAAAPKTGQNQCSRASEPDVSQNVTPKETAQSSSCNTN